MERFLVALYEEMSLERKKKTKKGQLFYVFGIYFMYGVKVQEEYCRQILEEIPDP